MRSGDANGGSLAWRDAWVLVLNAAQISSPLEKEVTLTLSRTLSSFGANLTPIAMEENADTETTSTLPSFAAASQFLRFWLSNSRRIDS